VEHLYYDNSHKFVKKVVQKKNSWPYAVKLELSPAQQTLIANNNISVAAPFAMHNVDYRGSLGRG
jgi:hypothetical protein